MKFRQLASYLEKLEATSSRNEITQILSELFKETSEDEIDKVVYLASGNLAPSYMGINFNVAEKLMMRIIAKAFSVELEKIKEEYKKQGDLGAVAEQFAKGKGGDASISEVYETLFEMARQGGGGSQERKIAQTANLLSSLDPISVRFVVRIPIGNLRLGFSDMTILDALSYMEKGDKSARSQIEAAFNVTVDIGKIAKAVKQKGVDGLKGVQPEPGTPIRPSLAERLPSAEKILEKVGNTVIVEPKYDGFRCITGYTPLYVKDKGYISVKDVKVGNLVLTHKGRFKKVLAINRRNINKRERLFKFQTYLGNGFKISEGHNILVWKNGMAIWTPVERVRIGEEVAFPLMDFQARKSPLLPNPHLRLQDGAGYKKIIPTSDDFYRFLGFWVGDGFTNNYHNSERVGLLFNATTERDLAEEYKKIITETLGIAIVSEYEHNGALSLYWRDKPFRQWLTEFFRREWRGKTVPAWFEGLRKREFLAFLRGWIESDGTSRNAGGYRIVTKERDLAAFIQLISLSHGKIIGLRRIRSKIKSVGFAGTYYELIIPGTERKARIVDGKILVKILRKEEIKRVDPRTRLYNLQVEGDESYCTSMAALHNCQIHTRKETEGQKVQIFSRNLENTTSMFPDIVEAVKKINVDSAIFDAEAIAYDSKSGKFLPFQETSQRKRKYGIAEAVKNLPLKLFVFDILYKNGKSLLDLPFNKRRKILEDTIVGIDGVEVTRQEITGNADVIRDLIKKYLSEGLEGALIKKIDAPYKAGARGYHWVKYKKTTEEGIADTIDCLVMGVNRGKGKRAGFGVGAFLVGIKDGNKFKTTSKIGTGLTDEQWRELDIRSKNLETKDKPKEYEVDKNLVPHAWMKPSLVVEILADEITKSPIHAAGLALRFPRLIRFRDEKGPQETTTLGELTKLYKMQKG